MTNLEEPKKPKYDFGPLIAYGKVLGVFILALFLSTLVDRNKSINILGDKIPLDSAVFIGVILPFILAYLFKIRKIIFKIIFVILIIGGIISLFCGLAAISTTNFILLLILWGIMSKNE